MCAHPWVPCPAHPSPRGYHRDISLPKPLWVLVTLCLPFPAAAPLIFSGSPTMWIMYFSFPSSAEGLPKVQVLPGKTQQLRSCVCSCSAAPTPQGRHPSHEYIQDIWINENISSLEPNVNQALLKSTEKKISTSA